MDATQSQHLELDVKKNKQTSWFWPKLVWQTELSSCSVNTCSLPLLAWTFQLAVSDSPSISPSNPVNAILQHGPKAEFWKSLKSAEYAKHINGGDGNEAASYARDALLLASHYTTAFSPIDFCSGKKKKHILNISFICQQNGFGTSETSYAWKISLLANQAILTFNSITWSKKWCN